MRSVTMKTKYLRHPFALLFTLTLSWFYTISALADGCMFYSKKELLGNPPDSPSQRALILHDGATEKLIVQVKYQGQAMDFSWVLPLPAVPPSDAIKTTDDEIFNTLYSMTQPRIYYVESLNGARYWGERGPKEAADAANQPAPIQIWQQLNVGPYFITTLSSTQKDALVTWLNANDYYFPDNASETLQYYIDKQWCFVAVKVNFQSRESSRSAKSLVPLEITFNTPEIVFPLRISGISAAPSSEILLYVISTHRTICNYQTKEVDEVKLREDVEAWFQGSNESGIACGCKNPSDSEEYDYEAFFLRELYSCRKPTFMVEYADYFYSQLRADFKTILSPDTTYYLTRFRTFLAADQMKDDVVFKPDPDGDNSLRLQIYYHYAANSFGRTWFPLICMVGMIMLPINIIPKFRKKYARKAWLFLLILVIAI